MDESGNAILNTGSTPLNIGTLAAGSYSCLTQGLPKDLEVSYFNCDTPNPLVFNVTSGTSTVPGAPTIGAAIAGDAQATITFTPPSSDGGSPISLYEVYGNGGTTILKTGTSSPITVTGLANDVAYFFSVKARNSVGAGPASANSNIVTPRAKPVLTYPLSSYSWLRGSPISTVTPTLTGSGISCTVSPALPSGLSLNSSTCAITGTPTVGINSSV